MEKKLDIKYKKVSNNKNAIEIDGKVVLSFDPRYKEYLKWREVNPELENKLLEELQVEIENLRLYNNGAPHFDNGGYWKWYNENGELILTRETLGDKKHGKEILYFGNGEKMTESLYKNGKFVIPEISPMIVLPSASP